MYRFTVFLRHMFFHFVPYRIGDGNSVAIEIHGEGRHHMGLGAKAHRRPQRLPRQHMGAIQLAINHPVQQHLPIGLGFQGHEQAFFLEVAFLIGDGQRRHVRQFDKTELEIGLLRPAHSIIRHGRCRQAQCHRGQHTSKCFLETFHHPSLFCPFFFGHKKSAQSVPPPLAGIFERLCSHRSAVAVDHTDGYLAHNAVIVLTLS